MSSVRSGCGHSTDWEAGVWLGCHAHCGKLAKVESIWDMVTDSTEDSGSTGACLLYPIPRSPGHRLLADGLSQHGCRQVHDNRLAGNDRHNCGHEMMPGGLPASLSGRLTESTVWSEDRILLGLDS